MKEFDYSTKLNISQLRVTDKIHYFCVECGTECSIYKKNFTELLCGYCKAKKKRIKKSKLKKIDKRTLSETKEKIKQINRKKYGVDYFFQSKAFQEKREKTLIEKYGSKEEFYKLQNKKAEETFKKNHTETKGEFLKNAFQSKYNVENARNLDFVNEKIKSTCQEKYNSNSPLENNEINKKGKQTFFNKYGVKSTFAFDDVRQKSKKTMKKKYGVELPGLSSEIMAKAHGKYVYNNILFDSSWEIAYYIWLKDNNIDFEYHPNIKFEFWFNSEKHFYFPDFIVDNNIIEIKGNHFLSKDDKWINPYKPELNDLYEAKHQCLVKHNVNIILDCSIYINFVNEKYGKTFLSSCKKVKN